MALAINNQDEQTLQTHITRASLIGFTLLLLPHSVACADEPVRDDGLIRATGCFLRLKDQAHVPARDAGVLQQVQVELGDSVKAGDTLASLDKTDAEIALRLAQIDHQVASKKAKESVAVEIADSAILESDKLIQQAKIDLQVAKKMADSSIAIRQAQAAKALATEELGRAIASRKQFDGSVSDLELARKQYEVDRSGLDIEQAQYDKDVQTLRSNSKLAFLEQNEFAGRRMKLEQQDATTQRAISVLSASRASAGVEVTQENLKRRTITSPLTGIIVERMKQQGEWVEAGEPVVRIVRLDTLLVEGYVAANLMDLSDRGRKVTVSGATKNGTVNVEGRIVFVSPEVDSVNGQVMIKAEINNPNLKLRPGQRVEMTIAATGR